MVVGIVVPAGFGVTMDGCDKIIAGVVVVVVVVGVLLRSGGAGGGVGVGVV